MVYLHVIWASLVSVGVAVSIVLPLHGPAVRARDLLRPLFNDSLDCLKCFSWWCGAIIACLFLPWSFHPAWLGVPFVSLLLAWILVRSLKEEDHDL